MWEYVESWEEKTSLRSRPEVLSAISLPTNLNLDRGYHNSLWGAEPN